MTKILSENSIWDIYLQYVFLVFIYLFIKYIPTLLIDILHTSENIGKIQSYKEQTAKAEVFPPKRGLCSRTLPCSSGYWIGSCLRAEAPLCSLCLHLHLPWSRCAINICSVNMCRPVTNKAKVPLPLPGSEELRFYCVFPGQEENKPF